MVCKHCGCENLEGTTLCVFCGEPMETPDQSVSKIMSAFGGSAASEEGAGEVYSEEGDLRFVSSLRRPRRTETAPEEAPAEGESRAALQEARALMHCAREEGIAEAVREGEDFSEQAARIVEQAVERIVNGPSPEVAGEETPQGDPLALAQAEEAPQIREGEGSDREQAPSPEAPAEEAGDAEEGREAKRIPIPVPPSPLNFEMDDEPEEQEELPTAIPLFVKTAAEGSLEAPVAAAAVGVSNSLDTRDIPEGAEFSEAASGMKGPEAAEQMNQPDLPEGPAVSPIATAPSEEKELTEEASQEAEGKKEETEEQTEEETAKTVPSSPLPPTEGGNLPPADQEPRKKRGLWLILLLLLLAGGAVYGVTQLLKSPSVNPSETGADFTTEDGSGGSGTIEDTAAFSTTVPVTEEDSTEASGGETTKTPATTKTPETTRTPETTPAPTTVPPTVPDPTTEESSTEAPTTPDPTTEPPTTPAPTTEPPTTPAPTTVPPTTPAPTTVPPTTPAPTTVPPTTPAPTTEARRKNPYHYLAQAKVGDVIRFGAIDQDGVAGAEAIEWLVLAKSGGRILVISRYCFVTGVYSTASPAVWSTSQARNWLNGGFFASAFSAEDRNQVMYTKIKTPANPQSGQSGGADTTDQVFLLSIQEVQQYMSPSQVATSATPTARNSGAYIVGGEVFWWLRSPGDGPATCAHTRSGGAIDFVGENATVRGALRPAMWLNADQAEYLP